MALRVYNPLFVNIVIAGVNEAGLKEPLGLSADEGMTVQNLGLSAKNSDEF